MKIEIIFLIEIEPEIKTVGGGWMRWVTRIDGGSDNKEVSLLSVSITSSKL